MYITFGVQNVKQTHDIDFLEVERLINNDPPFEVLSLAPSTDLVLDRGFS